MSWICPRLACTLSSDTCTPLSNPSEPVQRASRPGSTQRQEANGQTFAQTSTNTLKTCNEVCCQPPAALRGHLVEAIYESKGMRCSVSGQYRNLTVMERKLDAQTEAEGWIGDMVQCSIATLLMLAQDSDRD